MIWRTDEERSHWPLRLDSGKRWVLVDVVGHAQELPVDASGHANIAISASPFYVVERVTALGRFSTVKRTLALTTVHQTIGSVCSAMNRYSLSFRHLGHSRRAGFRSSYCYNR